jgi:hypothetical protein
MPELSGPVWLNDVFAGVMVAVALYSVGRLIAARAWARPIHTDVDIAHVLMGTAMAGMLVSAINPIPNGVWEVVFSVLAAWFVWRCYQYVTDPAIDARLDDHVHRLSRRVIHLVMSLAMLYMYLAAATPTVGTIDGMTMGSASGTTADFVGIPFLFLCALFASAIWELDGIERFAPRPSDSLALPELVRSGSHGPSTGSPPTSEGTGDPGTLDTPWLAPHVAMCITMGYMLVLML